MAKRQFKWARKESPSYEVSTAGDKRFSAFTAKLPDGRSIEEWYQCDVKGYDFGGRNWRLGKGKAPLFNYPGDHLYEMYLSLWRLWAIRNPELIRELKAQAIKNDYCLSDCFASSPINQARALVQILNEWC